MRKIKFTLLVGLVVLMVAMFMGCDLEALIGGAGEKTGELIIEFSSAKGRSINWEPEISMEIDSYEISGIGPDKRTFGPIMADGTKSVHVPGLREGSWTVTVLGLNNTKDAIGESVKSVTIEAGRTKSATFTVEEYSGNGTLAIEVQWPEGEVGNPHILVEITTIIGEEPVQSFVMTPSETLPAVAEEESTLAAGYYSITISIHDGTPSDDNWITGVNGSIRIAEDQTTFGSLIFDEDSLRLFGDLSVKIEDGMLVPFSVALSKDSDKVWEEHPVTLTATPSLPGDYMYYWFIDGKLQEEETDDKFVLADAPSYGSHFVGVTVLKNGIFASAYTKVIYMEDPGLFFVLQFLTHDTQEVVHTKKLEVSIPNFEVSEIFGGSEVLDNTFLTYRTIINRYKPPDTSSDWRDFRIIFYPIVASRELTKNNNVYNLDNLTMVGLEIQDFEGIGHYDFGEFDINGYLSTDQLDSNNTYYDVSSADSGWIEITEFGNVGEFVKGSAFINNATLSAFDADDLTFDIKADFSFKRDDDLIIQYYALTYMVSEKFRLIVYTLPGTEEWLQYSFTSSDGTTYNVSSWSTELNGGGDKYDDPDEQFTMPDHDVILYPSYN